eukprot:scaffold11716_cov165-Amphora_coffeaeformis.AAC.3
MASYNDEDAIVHVTEYSTAEQAIKKACPGAEVVGNRTNNYPIKVIVTADDETLWQGRQQDLFRKYSSKRQKSMEEIAAKAKELMEKKRQASS